MVHVEDKSLLLPDGRTLAYADNGNTSSPSVVLFLHGAFAVGDASRLPRVLVESNVHLVTPSLPGWGKTSPVHAPSSYAVSFATDITTLIAHLHPQTDQVKLYICGHSFGTIPAQILYGLSHDIFPLGRQIAALVLLAPFSPPHCHGEYAKSLTWPSYFMIGPPAHYTPFNITLRIVKLFTVNHVSSQTAAEALFRESRKGSTSDEEQEKFSRWLEEQGIDEVQFCKEVGRNTVGSVARSWRGFLDIPAIYHSGWGGFHPEHVMNKCPVVVVSSKDDVAAPEAMAMWISENYYSTTLKRISGSHISSFFYLNEILGEVLAPHSNLSGS
ncbi:Alpha/Beta hydrolase protein [Collybia nuda]|uniref:Alpha/Beta hydrolase protein n=1 Tax=Collybia nuda TaxID=64659 RepID=A0A9P6CP89_9AGAR|nr:Alpha/Beta hydrolase protein [Collybia nuda]